MTLEAGCVFCCNVERALRCLAHFCQRALVEETVDTATAIECV